jgi:hypothetical protein
MAFEPGPERRVRTPGASDRLESREVAKVSVTKGRDLEASSELGVGGRRGSRRAADSAGNVSFSAIVIFVRKKMKMDAEQNYRGNERGKKGGKRSRRK